MVLEFAALSRLTGKPRFERAARTAFQALWERRSSQTELVGEVINVTNGKWLKHDAGVGAGIDSYYEYLLKAYVLLVGAPSSPVHIQPNTGTQIHGHTCMLMHANAYTNSTTRSHTHEGMHAHSLRHYA